MNGAEDNAVLRISRLDAVPVTDSSAVLGESPVWSAAERCVWWVDSGGHTLFRTLEGGETRAWRTPEQIGFVVVAEDGEVLAGLKTGLFGFNPDGGAFERLLALDVPGVRFNDAAVGAGRIWASTMALDVESPMGAVLRIDPDLSVTECWSGLRRPNGLAVDEGRGRIYVSDSHPDVQGIWAGELNVASGAVSDWRPFATTFDTPGRPDGAAIDAGGNYLIASVDGGSIDVYAPDGARLERLEVPVREPTKLAFGGDGLTDIYITSKNAAGDEFGGRLLRTPIGRRGRAVTGFARSSSSTRARR